MNNHLLASFDVSDLAILRRALSRATLGFKIACLLSGIGPVIVTLLFGVGIYSDWIDGTSLSLMEAMLFLVFGCISFLILAFLLPMVRKVRLGDRRAMRIAFAYYALWSSLQIYVFVSKDLDTLDYANACIALLVLTPIYFMVRAFLFKGKADKLYPVISSFILERAIQKKKSMFMNKFSLKSYVILTFGVLFSGMLFVGYLKAEMDESDQASRVIGLIAMIAFPLMSFGFFYHKARQHAVLRAADLMRRDSRPPVLYLRSFKDESIYIRSLVNIVNARVSKRLKVTFEQAVADHLQQIGPVVAIGKPGDRLAPLGAARDYVQEGSWQQRVEDLMQRASLIVVALGRTEGLVWEIGRVVEMNMIFKLVFLFPPLREKELRARWDNICKSVHALSAYRLHGIADFSAVTAVMFSRNGVPLFITDKKRKDLHYDLTLDMALYFSRAEPRGPEPSSPPDAHRAALTGRPTASSSRARFTAGAYHEGNPL